MQQPGAHLCFRVCRWLYTVRNWLAGAQVRKHLRCEPLASRISCVWAVSSSADRERLLPTCSSHAC